MALADLPQIMQVPGRLCITPTNLALPFPHGGTALGEVHNAVVMPTQSWFTVRAEEFGALPVETVFSGESWAFGCTLRQWDNDAMAAVFPNITTGATTKRAGVRHWLDQSSSQKRPGAIGSAMGVKLLFSPLDPDRNRAVILYRAIPRVGEALSLALAFDTRQEVPVLFVAIPDSTSRLGRIDFLRELSV